MGYFCGHLYARNHHGIAYFLQSYSTNMMCALFYAPQCMYVGVYVDDLLKDSFVVMSDDGNTSWTEWPHGAVRFDVADVSADRHADVC